MMEWYAARVRSRCELRVISALNYKQVESFTPCWAEHRTYSDRVRHTQVAAFPGYVFCRIDLMERLMVLNTPGVQSLVGTGGSAESIDDDVIAGLRKAFSRAELVSPVPYVAAGRKVRVLCGPMAGAEGTLLREKGRDRLVISVELLQRSVAVEVDAESVSTLGPDGLECPRVGYIAQTTVPA